MIKNCTLTVILLVLSLVSFGQIGPINGAYNVCIGKTTTFTDTTGGGTWSSSNTAVATIGLSTGVITGISTGTSMFTYTVGGGFALHYILVNPLPAAISGATSVCAGSTISLTDGTGGGVWSSSSTGTATVGPAGVVTGVSSGVATITYLLTTGCYVTTAVTVHATPTIYGPSSVCVGTSVTLSDSTGGGSWISSNTAVATVGATSGVVTGIAVGTCTIYYSAGGCYGYRTFTVTSSATITGSSTLCVGGSITLTGAPGGGSWTEGATSVATVGLTSGVVTGVSLGTTNIYYAVGGCFAYHTVTVISGPAAISGSSTVCTGSTITLTDATGGGTWTSGSTSVATVSSIGAVTGVSAGVATITYKLTSGCYVTKTITVTGGASIYGPSTLCVGSSITLTDSTLGGSWISSNTSIATVGTTGIVTGISAGTCTIYYSSGGCYGYHTVTVTSGATITGPSTVCVGGTMTLSDSPTGGTWTDGVSSIATVGFTSGVVTGVSTGVTNIYYSVGGCFAYHTVSVISGPAAISGSSALCSGSTITLTDATGGGTWTSSNTGIATVTSIGVVTGISSGVVTITYKLTSGCYVTKTITVSGGAHSISGPSTVCVGSTITLSDSTGVGSWISSNTAIATVSMTSGVVTGIGTGTCTIYYSSGGCYAYHTVTVISGSTITGPSTVCAGSTITLTDATPGGTWISSNTALATVSSTGVVTGVSAGTVNIYYSDGGCSAYHTVTVTGGAAITGPSTVCVGSTISLTDATGGGTWTSSNSAVASVSSTGVVTGHSAGVVNIYYLAGGCYAYHTVTVTGGTSIAGPSSVCVGSTITLTDSTGGGSWLSSNTAVATVGVTSGVVTGVSSGTCTIYYIAGGCYGHTTITVTSGPAAISGASSVCAGSTTTLTDATGGGTWTSSSTGIATVTSIGVVTGVSAGVVTITYKLTSGCYATKTVTVSGGASISGPSTVCVGSTVTLSDITGGGSWTSSNTAVATVGRTSGVVTGIATGTCTIYYFAGGCYAYHTFTVTGASTITGPSTVCVGSTISLTDATPGGSWISGNTTLATVSSTGVVTGVAAGVLNIYYSDGGCSAYHTVTVTGGSSISGPTTVCVGSTITLSDAGGGSWLSSDTTKAKVGITSGVVTGISAGTCTIYYIVAGCYAHTTITITGGSSISGPTSVCIGSSVTLSDVGGGSWLSSNTAVATVGATSGVVSGITAGTCTIYYVAGGCYSHITMTVTGTSTITGPSTVCVGSAISLTDATPGGSWISSNTTIATVSSIGVVTGVSAGVVNIYYAGGGCGAYHTVTVTGGASISGPSTVCVGSTITLSDVGGGSWISSDTSVATVGITSGVVTGLSAGTCTVYYIAGGCYAYTTITVTGAATISGPSVVCVGSTISLSDATPGGTWTSSNTAVALVDATGTVTGISNGVVNIYYYNGGCYAFHTVTVSGTSTISGLTSVCVGNTLTLVDATPGGSWSSSDTSVATVSSTGIVTGVSPGVVTIYYTIGGCGAFHVVTVNEAPGAISGFSTVAVGSTINLTDATPGGTWISGNTALATVGSTGVVTGVAVGVLNIYYVIGGCGSYHTVTVTPLIPGEIDGMVVSGDSKGTTAEIPVSGLQINLEDATNNVIGTAVTDNTGAYSFKSLPDGEYIIYPKDINYTTTPSPVITISSSSETVSNVNFKEYTGSRTIAPYTIVTRTNSLSSSGEVSIYPNPANGILNIKWENQATGNATIVLTDVVGRETYKSTINISTASGQTQIDLKDLKNGMYLVTIKSDNIYYSAKLMIQQ